MIITKRNYNKVLEKTSNYNLQLSEEFLEMLNKANIKNLNLISVGNSISAGYSKCDEITPFLMRSNIYKLSDNIDYYSYARVRRNEELNIFKWYSNNVTNETISKLNIDDILVKEGKYAQNKWNDQTLEDYKNLSNGQNIGFKDLNINGNNIIIYNGLTGVFTNALRKGNIQDKLKLFKSLKQDLQNFKLVLTQFYIDNPHTQVYVCGLPNIMGTGIISFLDSTIKQICDYFPNVVFLPGTIRNSFFYLEGQKEFDVHYSVPEYIDLWNNITNSINDNYISNKLKLSLLKELTEYSLEVEKESTVSKGDEQQVYKLINETIEKHSSLFVANNINMNKTLEETAKYYNDNYLSTFACTPREKVLTKLKDTNKRL